MDYDKIIKRQNTTNVILNVLQYPTWVCFLAILIGVICAGLGYKVDWLLYLAAIGLFALPVFLLLIIIFGIYSV